MQDALIANVPYPHHPHLQLPTRRLKWYRQRFIRICTQAAAVLLLVAGSWYASRTVIIEDTAKQYLSVAAPAGQRIDITLQDGTSVCLNSGAKLEYPIRFNRNRRVKLSGEAMFNVEHDAAHPFIVETFACDVEVLGTKFNVTADELTHDFTTALLRGKVKVTNKLASGDQIILSERNLDIRPWGWDIAIRKRLLDLGVEESELPSIEQLDKLRFCSHRSCAVGLLPQLQLGACFCGESFYLTFPEEWKSFVESHDTCLLKAPLSRSEEHTSELQSH